MIKLHIIFFLSFCLLNTKLKIIKRKIISITPEDRIAQATPIKKTPVFITKKESANKQNKPIKVKHKKTEKQRAKNLITPIINLNKP